jgi:hypothetical protein
MGYMLDVSWGRYGGRVHKGMKESFVGGILTFIVVLAL